MGDDFKLEDIMIILQRRLLYFLVPTVLLMPVGIVAIMLLPAQYTAEGTILVESQQIPEQLLQTSGNSYAQERIQVIRQRVMTRDRLLGVADKFDLFPRSLNYSESEKVSKMRERLRLRLISADPGRRRSRQDGTIAFSVSYSDRAKDKAYLVANEFLTLFQTEDAKTRTRGASETTEFFEQETRRLRATVDALDGRVSTYKEQNSDALPEHLSLHIQQSERAAQDLNDTNSQISLAQEELRSLEMQLASYLTSGAAVDGPAQELSRLKAELASLKADKTDQHPDVRAVASQIRSIESQLQPSRTIQALRRELDAKQETLRAARTSDETSTEDLEALSIAVSEARQALSNQLTQEAAGAGNDFFAASLRGRMEIAINRLTALNEKATLLREQMNTLEDRIARTPAVERGLATLIRDRQNAYSQYEQIQGKQQQAVIAENLEENQKAEKFSILEPAVQPDKPSSPNRPKLIVMAIAGAIGAGMGCALLAELLMGAIRGRDHLTSLYGEPPIAIVPYVRLANERRFKLPAFGGGKSSSKGQDLRRAA